MSSALKNGTSYECPVYEKWIEHRAEVSNIAQSLERLSKSIDTLNHSLITAAVDKNSVPVKVYCATVLMLIMVIITVLVRTTDKDLHIDGKGFHLEGASENTTQGG